MGQRRRTKEEWLLLVEEYRNSGKTLSQWCEENGINRKTMSGYTYLKGKKSSYRSDQEWAALITQQKASGISRDGWCMENGINPNSMQSAVKRLMMRKQTLPAEPKEEDITSLQTSMPAPQKSETRWIEVGVADSMEASAPLGKEKIIPAKIHKEAWKACIVIRSGSLEIEADADYPIEHLEILLGKLAK